MEDFDALFDKERDNTTTLFAKKHQDMLEVSRFLLKSIKTYRQKGWHTHSEIWNIAFFMNIAAHDVSVLVFQLVTEREQWTRKLVARHVALALYETSEDLTQLLGKPIRDALRKLGLLSELDQELRQARQPLDDYWETSAPILKPIRVSSIAHREHNSVDLFETIDAINVDQILQLGLKFGGIQNKLGQKLQTLLLKTSEVRPPELDENRA